jgi:hypothetical protein
MPKSCTAVIDLCNSPEPEHQEPHRSVAGAVSYAARLPHSKPEIINLEDEDDDDDHAYAPRSRMIFKTDPNEHENDSPEVVALSAPGLKRQGLQFAVSSSPRMTKYQRPLTNNRTTTSRTVDDDDENVETIQIGNTQRPPPEYQVLDVFPDASLPYVQTLLNQFDNNMEQVISNMADNDYQKAPPSTKSKQNLGRRWFTCLCSNSMISCPPNPLLHLRIISNKHPINCFSIFHSSAYSDPRKY